MAEDATAQTESTGAGDAAKAAAQASADAGSAQAAYTRGQALTGAVVGLGAVMGLVIAAGPVVYALAPAFKSGTFFTIDLGPTSNFPDDGNYRAVTFDSHPDDVSGLYGRVAFIRNKGGTYTAIANTCMHLGCPVKYFPGTGFACPCHGGQYNIEGVRTAGPPVRPLNRYDTQVKDGHLFLGRLWAMDTNLNKHQLKAPGQPVTGLMAYLYPPAPQQ